MCSKICGRAANGRETEVQLTYMNISLFVNFLGC